MRLTFKPAHAAIIQEILLYARSLENAYKTNDADRAYLDLKTITPAVRAAVKLLRAWDQTI